MAAAGGRWVKGGSHSPGEARMFIPSRVATQGEVREIAARMRERFETLRSPYTTAGERNMIRSEIRYDRGEMQRILRRAG